MTNTQPRKVHLATAACLLWIAISGPARANGAFPDEFSVFFPAAQPHRILIGANFGMIVSEDDGATWRYACEPWITQGLDVALSPNSVGYYQVCADGAILADSIHLTRTGDGACTWPQSTGSIDNRLVNDIFAAPTDATFAVAILIDSSGNSSIVASHDGGRTFDSPPIFGPTKATLTGVEIARTEAKTIYATSVTSGAAGTDIELWSSHDRGGTWTSTPIQAPQYTQPAIMAVDPQDATVVYLRMTVAQTDSIVIAHGGGASFETALPPIHGLFVAFLRATDGTLYAATAAAELYSRAPGATQFTVIPGPHFRCLGQRPGASRIYACGDFTIDGFSLGYSDDGGRTLAKVMNFTDIQGPLTCAPVATACQAHWERVQQVLGIGDGGTGTPFDAGTGPGGTPDAGPQQDAGATTPPPPRSGKSGCSSAGAGLAAICIAALLATRRLRRSRITSYQCSP